MAPPGRGAILVCQAPQEFCLSANLRVFGQCERIKSKAPTGLGQGFVSVVDVSYSFFLRRTTRAKPARPPPRRRKVEGSGMVLLVN